MRYEIWIVLTDNSNWIFKNKNRYDFNLNFESAGALQHRWKKNILQIDFYIDFTPH